MIFKLNVETVPRVFNMYNFKNSLPYMWHTLAYLVF